jgi:DNA repair protein RadD
MIVLRPYQVDAANRVEQLLGTAARPLIVAPTGSGKTIILAEIIRRYIAKFKNVLVIAHRREIVDQTAAKFAAHGVYCGVIMAGAEDALRPQASVQVASVASLLVRSIKTDRVKLPIAHLVVIDEAHHAVAHSYRTIINAFPGAAVLGATATPCRGDGCGLGGTFTVLVESPQVAPLIEQKYLVRSRVYAPIDPDLKGVRTQSGDYVLDQLATRMNTDQLVGNIVEHWHRYAEQRRTVCFATSVAHSVHIVNEFIRSGVIAEHLDGSTPVKDREAILDRLATGKTQVVSNCAVLIEGWDLPVVACCILARPTKKMGLFRQMVGRTLRPYKGKPDAIILDHSGAVYRHGLPEDHVTWTLDPGRKAVAPVHERRKLGVERRLHECPACKALMTVPPCAACGWMPKPRARDVDVLDGELGLVSAGRAKATTYDPVTRERWHGMLYAIESRRGYKQNWARINYREKFGSWPAWGAVQPIEPTPEVLAWVRSRMIAFAKRRSAA